MVYIFKCIFYAGYIAYIVHLGILMLGMSYIAY
jgi:hypothetical protein